MLENESTNSVDEVSQQSGYHLLVKEKLNNLLHIFKGYLLHDDEGSLHALKQH